MGDWFTQFFGVKSPVCHNQDQACNETRLPFNEVCASAEPCDWEVGDFDPEDSLSGQREIGYSDGVRIFSGTLNCSYVLPTKKERTPVPLNLPCGTFATFAEGKNGQITLRQIEVGQLPVYLDSARARESSEIPFRIFATKGTMMEFRFVDGFLHTVRTNENETVPFQYQVKDGDGAADVVLLGGASTFSVHIDAIWDWWGGTFYDFAGAIAFKGMQFSKLRLDATYGDVREAKTFLTGSFGPFQLSDYSYELDISGRYGDHQNPDNPHILKISGTLEQDIRVNGESYHRGEKVTLKHVDTAHKTNDVSPYHPGNVSDLDWDISKD